eukprot:CAMPEP_0185285844 /NCGR_PEP_ID=MMETSP1363-20130426/1948_1 /TAXON_ID=38817 /ORGANISM="Gephyrocapsa oceanica, Strain RCC1303" /LENGTH=156 /DNA_ID=CAMNT_0027881635 /DNA_START=119 /DNA_END=590 /DNA_ORIENTATION=-
MRASRGVPPTSECASLRQCLPARRGMAAGAAENLARNTKIDDSRGGGEAAAHAEVRTLDPRLVTSRTRAPRLRWRRLQPAHPASLRLVEGAAALRELDVDGFGGDRLGVEGRVQGVNDHVRAEDDDCVAKRRQEVRKRTRKVRVSPPALVLRRENH